jgi:hypothetical protein
MRQILLLFLCVVLGSNAIAQKHYRMAGTLNMPGDPNVSYYLEFTEKAGRVQGYSITGYKDGNRLKAAVSGYFSTPSDLIVNETGSLDSSRALDQRYCYFSAHLKLTIMMDGRQRWNGSFQSHDQNGIPCFFAGAVMTLFDNAPPLEDKPKPKPKPVDPPKKIVVDTPKPQLIQPVIVKKDTPKAQPPAVVVPKPEPPKPIVIVQPAAPAPTPPQVPDSCQRTYDWSTNELAFDIWDGWTIDGDVVSLTINGRNLLNHAKLSDTKQRFSVPLVNGLNVLYISLHEEGFDPPNTPNLTLFDGSKSYELSISGEIGEVARICIWKR